MRMCYLETKTNMPAGPQLSRWLRRGALAGLTNYRIQKVSTCDTDLCNSVNTE